MLVRAILLSSFKGYKKWDFQVKFLNKLKKKTRMLLTGMYLNSTSILYHHKICKHV